MRLLSIFLFLFISIPGFGQQKDVHIHFNKNMELFGYLVHLAEPSESDPGHPVTKVLNGSAKDRNHPVLPQIFERSSEMSYAFFVDLLYALPELPLEEAFDTRGFLRNKYMDTPSEKRENTEVLIELLDSFVRTSDFETLWANLAPYRKEVLETLEQNKPSASLLRKMEEIYQQQFDRYTIVPSLTIWTTAGWGFRDTASQGAVFILGPLEKDYDFTNADNFQNLAIHEFGHSFVNAAVLKNTDLIEQTRSLFEPIKEFMSPQGYPRWEDCLVEHFVRAGEVFIPDAMGQTPGSGRLLNHYAEERHFAYLPFVVEKLKNYRLVRKLSYEQAVTQTLEDLRETMVPKSD